MARYIKRSKLKNTGGKYNFFRKKRKTEVVDDSPLPKLGKNKLRIKRTRGGNIKHNLIFAEFANLVTDKGMQKVKILDVTENKSNRHFVREDVITKGAIIKTEKGLAKVTSRPGQDGVVNAVLIKD